MNEYKVNICGCKLVELPYLEEFLLKSGKTLIVGEREGHEGVLSSVYKNTDKITTTDILPLSKDSLLEEYIRNTNIKFQRINFIDFPEDEKFDNIVCVNVLEHFGFVFSGDSDVINWNWDLKGIEKMVKLLNNNGRIIITVPAGPYVYYGDTLDNDMPMQRRYSPKRMKLIRKFIEKFNKQIKNERIYGSLDLINFKQTNEDSLHFSKHNQLETPNFIWAFCIE